MLIRTDDVVTHTTPNATMTTHAAPSLGSRELAVWMLAMGPGSTGPVHSVDGEQVLVVLTGSVSVDLDGEQIQAHAGDAIVLPADVSRRVHTREGTTGVVAARAGLIVSAEGRPNQPLPWAQ